MSVLHLSRLAVILVPTACALAACMGPRDTPDPVGESTSSGSSSGTGAGVGGAGGSKSHFGNTATTGTSADNTLQCKGDAGAWSQLTENPVPCQSGEECCVIMSPCLGDAQIVAAANEEAAFDAWPHCPVKCNDCLARPIEVACIDGSCLGHVIVTDPPVSADSPLRQNHCGTALEFAEPSLDKKMGYHFWPFGCGAQGGPEDEPDGGPNSGPDGGPNSGPDGGPNSGPDGGH
jgi:hypothetical protein